jgi:hypothetical protein
MSANGRARVNSECESDANGYSMDLGETSDRSRNQRIIAGAVRIIPRREPQAFGSELTTAKVLYPVGDWRTFKGSPPPVRLVPRRCSASLCWKPAPRFGLLNKGAQGHRLALEGAASCCPFLIGSGNGRQGARACFVRRPVPLLRRLRLDFGSAGFGFGPFCARCSRRRRSLGAAAPAE